MVYQESVFPVEQQEYYKIYAAENQLDYTELCLLDRLCSLNKRITWTLALEQLPCSQRQLKAAVQSLVRQKLIRTTFDLNILEDLHSRYNHWLEQGKETRERNDDPGPVHILA